MTIWILVLALGLVCIIEGLALALAPQRVEDLLRVLASISVEARRLVGVLAILIGVAVIAVARSFG